MFRLDMDDAVRSAISQLSPDRKKKIKESMRTIAANPTVGKALQQTLSGLCSYRVGALRIIYTIDRPRRMVRIIALGPRSTIYEEVEREILAR
ncbi:MAG: type II toxin-antitoxin system RelE/ParE family toxin [Deltaproteobacteria bacterium]|nr:type II toxin-antitoxin system RelE/ParE family toxin [Deltaproteobacteria bacterium]